MTETPQLTDYVFDLYFDNFTVDIGLNAQLFNLEYLDMDYTYSYIEQEHALPSMPTRVEYEEKGMTLSSLTQRLWETAEIQAIHISKLNGRVMELEFQMKELQDD